MRTKSTILALCLFLSACGGESAEVACSSTYQDDDLSTCLPAGWHIVDREQLDDRGVPGEVTVAFQSDTPVSGQFSTVTVTREILSQAMTSEEYSEASIASVESLPGYSEVDKRAITIDEADVQMHIFTAQPREDQPQSRFYQVSVVSPDNEGYTLTGATPVAVSDELEAQVAAILHGVSFQPVDGEEPADETEE
jgi:hypothetical protein